MSKNNNKPAVEVPTKKAEEASVVVAPETKKAFEPKGLNGMSPDAMVQYFATLHDRYSKNVPEDLKDNHAFLSGMNAITDMVAITIAVEEAVNKNTIFHGIVTKNEKGYAALALIAKEYDVEIPALNLLPAPTKEQLAKAGLSEEEGKNTAVVTISKENVGDKAKKKIAEEKKIVDSKPADSPTDVKDEKQLKASLLNIFIKGERPVARAKAAINFYRAYLKLQVKENQEELDKIEAMSDVELLSKVKNIIGPCPYKDKGISQFLRKSVAQSGSPVTAYNLLYRSARNRKTGEMEATDELIAAICRIYVIWSCEATIDDANSIIDSENRQLKKLDEKKNAEAIATVKANIKAKEADIEWANGVIATMINPDSSFVDNIIEAYNDDTAENHNLAVIVLEDTLKTYYPNMDMTQYEAECVENNAKQYIGIVTNLFRDPSAQMPDYTTSNLVELIKVEKPAEEKTEEETTQEEESKK